VLGRNQADLAGATDRDHRRISGQIDCIQGVRVVGFQRGIGVDMDAAGYRPLGPIGGGAHIEHDQRPPVVQPLP